MNRQDEMEIRELSYAEAREIYVNHLRKDFPRSEVKPFSRIRSGMRKGAYRCFGAFLGNELAGYAFLAHYRLGKTAVGLLDYFAVVTGRRGQGLGSEILRQLSPARLSLFCILIETEQIVPGLADADREIRERRVRFYERAGACRSGVSPVRSSFRYFFNDEVREKDRRGDGPAADGLCLPPDVRPFAVYRNGTGSQAAAVMTQAAAVMTLIC